MASFAFGFQLPDAADSNNASSSSSASATTATIAPPAFTAAAPDAMGHALPPPSVVVPLDAAASGSSLPAGPEDTREVPIGVGPPMRVTERVQGVMQNVSEGVDLIPGVYEGGLKVWESSVDLVRFMREQPQLSSLALGPSHAVLELGCGHGLPGIHAAQQGARVCFMDLNAEVLAHVTRPNLALNNCPPSPAMSAHPYERPPLTCLPPSAVSAPPPLLVSGDWADASRVLRRHWNRQGGAAEAGDGMEEEGPFFDLILSAETFYTADVTDKLLAAIQRHLKREKGAQALVAGKRFYFGTHGSVADLVARAERAGLAAGVLQSVEDGRSNIRDIVRLTWGDG